MRLNYSGTGFCEPFPHTIIDNFLDRDTVAAINREWPEQWQREEGRFQHKWNTQALPPTARAVVNAIDIGEVERMTGITGLFADPALVGAGLHCMRPGGFLNMHCDFNRHPNGWRRRVNLLVYLNERWDQTWNGHLILSEDGKPTGKFITPEKGRAVVFETNDRSWHGHPYTLNCPPGVQRRSLAVYYYTDETVAEPHSTVYRKPRKKGKRKPC